MPPAWALPAVSNKGKSSNVDFFMVTLLDLK
jgi:hypothetical protein